MNKLIELHNITAGYEGKTVLKNVSLTVWKNDFLGIIGPNGGGKTTLLRVILGLLSPTNGEIRFFRDEKPQSKLRLGYLPQTNMIDKKFPLSVQDVVFSGLVSEKSLFRSFTEKQKERVAQVLAQMGLEELKKNPIGELSGGQLQRVLLGRAIVSQPDVLILDEPNSYVDKQFESFFYEQLKEINKESAIMLVSHDIGTIIPLVKNVACVNEMLHYHAGAELTTEWLDEAYGCPIEIVGHGDFPHRVMKLHNK